MDIMQRDCRDISDLLVDRSFQAAYQKKGRHFGGIKVDTPDVEFRLTVRFIVAGLLFHPNLPTLVEG